MDDAAAIIAVVAAASSAKISDQQCSRSKTVNSKLQDYVSISADSCAVLLLWSGRSSVNDSLAKCYGGVFSRWPDPIRRNLLELMRRAFRFFHPRHTNGPKDADAVKLLEQLDSKQDVQLTDAVAPAFFKFLEERRVLPLQVQLKQAWADFNQERQASGAGKGKTADKENIPPPPRAPAPIQPAAALMQPAGPAPMQPAAALMQPAAAAPMQPAAALMQPVAAAPMQPAAALMQPAATAPMQPH